MCERVEKRNTETDLFGAGEEGEELYPDYPMWPSELFFYADPNESDLVNGPKQMTQLPR